ncbi:hypothetical protein BDP27DRAFT_1322321 [Rhodocollybia butyracea]|uniref:Uncharacterized protein n=1 Tax=Rhodocollybia butyracea TaxID=206335 RepID=A0A9P5PXZ5_9AGAR|nr:hypothetical protein BDP27DRAFT_1322321 [Rhodocollybia butyracea]
MTPTEQEQNFANGFNCYVNVINTVCITIAGGFATLGILIAIWQLHQNLERTQTIQLLCCTFIWFCLMGEVILSPFVVFGQIRLNIEKEITLPLSVLSTVTVMAGDIVICWRAWVLLPQDIFWQVVLAIIMICHIASFIAILDPVTLATSLVVNMIATSLIGWKAWTYYRTMRELSTWRKSHVQKTLFFLIESGAIFLVIQLFSLIGLILPQQAGKSLETIFLFGDTSQGALYPIAVMILVHSNHSPIEETLYLTTQLSSFSVP